MTITIYTDGGARGNPGPAGAGAVIYQEEKEVATVSEFLGVQTNNWAEYEALIRALEVARETLGDPLPHVRVYLDSELIVKQLSGEYRVKDAALKKQYARVIGLVEESFPTVSFTHVRREKNTRADELANQAMDAHT
ncbi:MAG: ribonuclease HI family protein [Patescibacteria group bacterium UBA2163]